MGDRTFSAEDVIRIYQFFLTDNERETVDLFFEEMEEMPEEGPLQELFEGLRVLLELIRQLRSVLGGLFGILLRLAAFALPLLTVIMFASERMEILANELLNLEEVDA